MVCQRGLSKNFSWHMIYKNLFSSIHLVLILTPTTPTPNFPRHAKLQMNIDTDFSFKLQQNTKPAPSL